ncbi:hypothetical protein [Streptomyces sp. NPDC059224]|uniref:hypothetical protein n=1 Tax=Streptomyces sp. NPDC059224 TaxID=3346775 RepID=UPI0036A28AA2
MVPATHSMRDVAVTAERLQEDLARLQMQKQALERELAAVVAHLGSVRQALSAFESLMRAPATAEEAEVAKGVAPQADVAATDSASLATVPTPRDQEPAGERDGESADGQKKYGRLTEQIMEYFAGAGDIDVRARDVAAALGRDDDSGSINGVRSTLDRLVGASRIRRTGRGLYRAPRSRSAE